MAASSLAPSSNMYRTPPAAPASYADFDGFYAANVGPITAQIRAYVGDLQEAEDLVAEAFCRALGRWKTISAYDNPATWVRRVAWNLATSKLRRGAVLRRLLLRQRPIHIEGPQPDRIDLELALSELKERHRKAVILYYLADMTTAEIAEQEGVAEATVRSWLTRGRAALAELLRIDTTEERG
ncbi:RNA polymerase sigma-70 factor, ECF subfamily [Glycomyces harbinensis]|uniref:RNA polymerase sigma-70 factor, ECF subfamily n=2 Tax=Glycomyces harbinensis TaxID=58114 RepID=A0A1G6V2M1_9ACTN|nr:RNA polymerase sigma-70 factor, ECF subfamily [Glycomyces harbinensis]